VLGGGEFENGDDAVGPLLVVGEAGGAFRDDRVNAVAFVARKFAGDDGPRRVGADLDGGVGVGAQVEDPPGALRATGGRADDVELAVDFEAGYRVGALLAALGAGGGEQ
jgi:hypothetical protein